MIDPRRLARHYRGFLRGSRILFTGHSHQAWPDVAREGVLACHRDAEALADDKWGKAMEAADALRAAVARRIAAPDAEIALAASTHELVTRFISALDLRARPHLVTTSGEFHTIHRQLSRLREVGVDVTFVEAQPVATLAERLVTAIRSNTAAVLCSTVLFESSTRVPHLRALHDACVARGAEVLFDAYHAFNVVPFTIAELGPRAFVTAGGYKYAQWGEGCCFLRVPSDFEGRPVYTGWFADFAGLASPRRDGQGGFTPIGYGSRPADRFAGSTYDPTSHYRACAVDTFFQREGLDVASLRALSLAQTDRIFAGLEGHEVVTPRAPEGRGGFVAVRVPGARALVTTLRERGVFVDARGDLVRLGPAPYVDDDAIDEGMQIVRETIAGKPSRRARTPRLVLASTSEGRRALMDRLGVAYVAVSPRVDERAAEPKGVSLGDVAIALAVAKASSVDAKGAFVLGSDQIVEIDGEALHKPATLEEARAQLARLVGREHRLLTAVALRAPDGKSQTRLVEHVMRMRALRDDEIEAYVAVDRPLGCAGGYRVEALGIALFDAIEGPDFTAITGLPLIATVSLLRDAGLPVF